jgi:hypothetical protein
MDGCPASETAKVKPLAEKRTAQFVDIANNV